MARTPIPSLCRIELRHSALRRSAYSPSPCPQPRTGSGSEEGLRGRGLGPARPRLRRTREGGGRCVAAEGLSARQKTEAVSLATVSTATARDPRPVKPAGACP